MQERCLLLAVQSGYGSFYRGKSVRSSWWWRYRSLLMMLFTWRMWQRVICDPKKGIPRSRCYSGETEREGKRYLPYTEHQVKEIIGEAESNRVVLEDAAVIDVNGVFVAYGAVPPQTDLLKKFAATG